MEDSSFKFAIVKTQYITPPLADGYGLVADQPCQNKIFIRITNLVRPHPLGYVFP